MNNADQIRRFHRKRFDEIRPRYGRSSVGDVPGFVDSLRRLVELHEYGDTEVSIMFGVSRERVRQWRNDYGIEQKHRGSGQRVFDWALGRFLTLTASGARSARNRARTRARRWRRIKALLDQIRAVAETLNRAPALQEVFPTVNEQNNVAGLWSTHQHGERPHVRGYRVAWDELWRAAGFLRPHGLSVNAKLSRRNDVARVRAVAGRLGRTPRTGEVFVDRGEYNSAYKRWGGSMDRLWRAAGFRNRPGSRPRC